MRLAKTILAGSVLTVISSVALAQGTRQPPAAQQAPGMQTGVVKVINRMNGTIAIQEAQSGTVGAGAGGATEQFKIEHGLSDTVHAGDKVKFSVSETGGKKTITKIETQ